MNIRTATGSERGDNPVLRHVLRIGSAALVAAGAGIGLAQDNGPSGDFRHNKDAPVEIVSDSLEVRQAENLAIFTGNVIADQDTLRLTADRLTVHYGERSGEPGNASGDGPGAIRKIDAAGDVFLCNESQTAQGETGAYDIATGKIIMQGNVVLTQSGNAIAGPKLEIDLNTGVGRVIGTPGNPIRSFFVPTNAEDATVETAACNG